MRKGDLFYENGRFWQSNGRGSRKELFENVYWAMISSGGYVKIILKSTIHTIQGAIPNYLWRPVGNV